MGAMQNNADKAKKSSSKRGSVRNDDRLQVFAERRGVGGADWGACDPARMRAVVVAITALGGAATFGLSRDQGAYSVSLILDGNRQTLWFNGDADLDDELDGVTATLDAMT